MSKSKAGRCARQRTSEVRKSLTMRTKRRRVCRSIGDCPFAHAIASHAPRPPYSQPPVNPARRSPATKYGQRRVMSQIRPVR